MGTIQWLKDETLKEAFVNPWAGNGELHCYNPDYRWNPWILDDYKNRLKELLNWSKPKLFLGQITSGGILSNQFCVFYDEHSKACLNDWIHARHPSLEHLKTIRGPCVYIDYLEDGLEDRNPDTTILHKTIMHFNKYFYDKTYEGNKSKMERAGWIERKIITALIKTDLC